MAGLVRFVARRALRRLGTRSRLVSRTLVFVGLVRWWNGRARSRRYVNVGRGETLVVSLGANERADHGF